MKFTLQRLFFTKGLLKGDYTVGFLTENSGRFRSFCIEDTWRAQKVFGETRIPAGLYQLKIHAAETPLTLKNRLAYNTPSNNWFKFHIEVMGIPGYGDVFIHSGNDDSHTEGCLLPNYVVDSSAPDMPGSKSIIAVEAFYKLAYPILESGSDTILLDVRDETFLQLKQP